MRDKGRAMVMAAFVADALALGAHWIYDTEKISRDFGRVDTFMKPAADSYHPTKGLGEFTHYGDQSFVLLESIAAKKGFDITDFSNRWRALFEGYRGYVDKATRTTLSNYAAGKSIEEAGSPSNELAGASRMAPLVYGDRQYPDKLVNDAREQTSMTHKDPLTVDGAEFFARVASLVLTGVSPVKAMKQVIQERFAGSDLSRWLTDGLASKHEESVALISTFGQS